MKKLKIFTICLMVSCLFFIGCDPAPKPDYTREVEAEVLTINENIFSGKTIGQFLGSSSRTIANDVIKIGVKFEYGGELFLDDLELKHAELAYFKDRKTLPLTLEINNSYDYYYITVCLINRVVTEISVSSNLHNEIKQNLEKNTIKK